MKERRLSYPQWFALLALKCFADVPPGRVLRRNTMASLVRRRFAVERPLGNFNITPQGIAAESFGPPGYAEAQCREHHMTAGLSVEISR